MGLEVVQLVKYLPQLLEDLIPIPRTNVVVWGIVVHNSNSSTGEAETGAFQRLAGYLV